jgi:hypothetical protein
VRRVIPSAGDDGSLAAFSDAVDLAAMNTILSLHSAYNMRYYTRMSSETTKAKLLRMRAGLIAELGTLSRLLHGSWVERYSVCSRAGCACHRGERHGPRHYLVVNEAGRQRQKYIPNSQVETAQEGLAQHHRLREIVDEITRLNLKLMKEDAHERR